MHSKSSCRRFDECFRSAGEDDFSHKPCITNIAQLTKKKKCLIIINVCIDWRTEWKTGIHAKFVILLKYRNYYYYYVSENRGFRDLKKYYAYRFGCPIKDVKKRRTRTRWQGRRLFYLLFYTVYCSGIRLTINTICGKFYYSTYRGLIFKIWSFFLTTEKL